MTMPLLSNEDRLVAIGMVEGGLSMSVEAASVPLTALAWASGSSTCPNDFKLKPQGSVITDIQFVSEKESLPSGFYYIAEFLEPTMDGVPFALHPKFDCQPNGNYNYSFTVEKTAADRPQFRSALQSLEA
ncbi:UNVERIFIED_CONTAM: hypothetical protein FKN15_029007 [Acipenser sinensis]